MTTDIPAASATPSVRALYGAYWRNAKGKRLHILYSSLLLIGSQLIKLGIPWLAAQAINTIQTTGVANLTGAGFYMLLIILTVCASWAMHGPGRIIERNVAVQVRRNVADRLYARRACRSPGTRRITPAIRFIAWRKPPTHCSASRRASSCICRASSIWPAPSSR